MSIRPAPLPLSPAEIRLILRLRQISNQNLARMVLLDLGKMTISLVKSPEMLNHEGRGNMYKHKKQEEWDEWVG